MNVLHFRYFAPFLKPERVRGQYGGKSRPNFALFDLLGGRGWLNIGLTFTSLAYDLTSYILLTGHCSAICSEVRGRVLKIKKTHRQNIKACKCGLNNKQNCRWLCVCVYACGGVGGEHWAMSAVNEVAEVGRPWHHCYRCAVKLTHLVTWHVYTSVHTVHSISSDWLFQFAWSVVALI